MNSGVVDHRRYKCLDDASRPTTHYHCLSRARGQWMQWIVLSSLQSSSRIWSHMADIQCSLNQDLIDIMEPSYPDKKARRSRVSRYPWSVHQLSPVQPSSKARCSPKKAFCTIIPLVPSEVYLSWLFLDGFQCVKLELAGMDSTQEESGKCIIQYLQYTNFDGSLQNEECLLQS